MQVMNLKQLGHAYAAIHLDTHGLTVLNILASQA
jgi:hypothetical protein